jgi:hypothetical protein
MNKIKIKKKAMFTATILTLADLSHRYLRNQIFWPGVVAHTFNTNTQEFEAGRSRV